MHILDADQTAAALPYGPLVAALEIATQELSAGRIRAPERLVVNIDPASVLLCMPATAEDLSVTKLVTVHAGNASHGLPAIQGEVVVFETDTGRRIALLDGPTVTGRRTAAMTLLGIQTLLPRAPRSALLIGTGAQAVAHAEALADHFGVRQFWVAARELAKMQAFCAQLCARYPDVVASPLPMHMLQQELPDCDVLIALTTARSAVIPEHLPPTTLAIGVGAFKPDMVEFPPALLQARAIVVDDPAGARHEAGDLIQAGVDWSGVSAIGQVISGQVARADLARQGALPVFKTVGQAAWDLAAARVARSLLAG